MFKSANSDIENIEYKKVFSTKSLIEAHQNPIVKLATTTGNKIYLSKNIEEETKTLTSNLEILKKTISFPRIERRCARSQGIWLEDECLVKLTKKRCHNFGFQNKSGIYLYPEEALYLLEINKLEISWNGIPISIQRGYELILKDSVCPLNKYKVYKKLAVQGHRISRYREIPLKVDEPETKRIKLIDDNTPSTSKDICKQKDTTEIDIIKHNFSLHYDYRIYNPRAKENHNVYIIANGELDPKLGLLDDSSSSLFGIAFPDNVAFYKFSKVEIPDLSKEVS